MTRPHRWLRRLGTGAVAAALLATSVTAAAEETAPPSSAAAANLLDHGSFEEVGPDGSPVGWSPLWASSAEHFDVVDTDATDGQRSLRIRDVDTTRGGGLRPEAVPVSAGETYEFAADLRFTEGVLRPTVYFYDEAGARLAQPAANLRPEPGRWQRLSAQFTAPDGAVSAEPLVYSSIGGVADGLIDDVAFTVADPGEGPAGVEEDLGEPIGGVTNAGAGYTADADGRAIGVVVAGGSPSQFSAIDIATGERLMTETVPGSTATWAHTTTPDRLIYLGTSSGQVWRFDPDALSLTKVADQPLGETYFWEAGVDESGRVLFGTYPNGKIIAFDPATGAWQDYGVQVEGNRYARSIAVDGRYVYTGGGSVRASLSRLDTRTGEIVEIALPAVYDDQQFTYDTSVAGDLLFARLTPSNDVVVYSLSEQAWVDTITGVVGLDVSPAVQTQDSGRTRSEALVVMVGGGVTAYDVETRERRTISMDLGGAGARGWAELAVGLDGFPGTSLVTATSKAVFHVWNPSTGQATSIAGDATPTPFQIRSMATGPQGDVYVGGYLSPPGIAHVDADTGESELLVGPSQTEGMVAHGDDLVLGTYPGARLYTHDTTRPWDPATNPDTSAAAAIHIGHGQDRPLGWASAGDVVAIGTMPDYGRLGGALSLFDPDTGDLDVYPEVVEDQTVLSLAYHDGLIYGGTEIWGGLGVEPSTTEGHLFVFDPATGEVVFRTVPVPGEENVSALTFDDEGNLWGFTANELFRFDPETREVARTERYFDVDDSNAYATGRELFWHAGMLVGQSTGRLFEIDPDTLEMTVIQDRVGNLAIDRHGSYYYNRGGRVFRWVPQNPTPRCTDTVTGTHDGPLSVTGSATLCLTAAAVNGPVTVGGGASVLVEDSTVTGPLRTDGATSVTVRASTVNGPVEVNSTIGAVTISATTITGPLSCSGNARAPSDDGKPNDVTGPTSGQCADL